uniref:Uncharacterized protein n=1 Tax=Tetraselmis sp. GSL018 TaxID=582737 RepID=A0A061RNT6_9CHLO
MNPMHCTGFDGVGKAVERASKRRDAQAGEDVGSRAGGAEGSSLGIVETTSPT